VGPHPHNYTVGHRGFQEALRAGILRAVDWNGDRRDRDACHAGDAAGFGRRRQVREKPADARSGERLEQLCDYTAMARIRSDDKNYLPDRAVANASGEALVVRDTLDTQGGAFRSRGKWYALSFTCQAAPDHMSVISFKIHDRAGNP